MQTSGVWPMVEMIPGLQILSLTALFIRILAKVPGRKVAKTFLAGGLNGSSDG